MSATLGSPFGRAPAIAGERVLCARLSPLRRLRRHLSQRERHFANLIITQIGRENKFSAEIFVSVISPLRMQRERQRSCFVCKAQFSLDSNSLQNFICCKRTTVIFHLLRQKGHSCVPVQRDQLEIQAESVRIL